MSCSIVMFPRSNMSEGGGAEALLCRSYVHNCFRYGLKRQVDIGFLT